MSNWDNDDNDQYGNGGQGLRAQLEKALADKKAAEQERDQARAELTESKGVTVLAGKGYGPAVARFAIADGVDLSDEKALTKWLTDNGDLFAKPEKPATPEGQQDGETPPEAQQQQQQEVPPEVRQTYGALGDLHAAASPALVSTYDRIMASIPEDATPEQVIAALRGK